mmetsp:Transcript_31905/g.77754  ORF Transcript_31905/g.77754 Transcript_31905/m.77754 type:complete len:304 (+) Transcript_31905:250-1161(+)|eukprot:CAMPEP_0114524828 /NCGR_PEP_ID=MMETSP0109-20121206/22074_1 /TAXON_ID=29199 /ORGANISM="Chlorarachnion reptans, Strain CCCM449" /LENGTH=303 /DNA_ID=CAMNT_0001706319 /DNA_START=152 /DNA_END=1063 /DNA_ORIENTATION=-
MGQVLASLFSKKPACDIVVDIENAKPSEREKKTYQEVKEVLERNELIMKLILEYKGCQKLCQQAMQKPTPETEQAAFEGLLGTIESIQQIHIHSKAIGEAAKLLLQALARDDAKQTLADQQALVKQLGDTFVFIIDFDQKRLECPQLSNDFAFYRRLLPKFPKHPDVKVRAEEASSMAFFTAKSFPMISAVATETNDLLGSNAAVLPLVGTMANACYNMLSKKSFERKDTNLFLAKAMTGAIVVYDNVSPNGVFVRTSHVQIKDAIKLLKKEFPDNPYLLNAVRYFTKHFRDDCPSNIQALFE